MTELLSCPFCGGEAHTRTNTVFDKNFKWTVECETEGCMAFSGCSFYRTEAEAVDAWNARDERTCHIEMYPLGLHEEDGEAPICSACRVAIDEDVYYCPNCGARVVEEK